MTEIANRKLSIIGLIISFISLMIAALVLYLSHLRNESLQVFLSPNISIEMSARSPSIGASMTFLNNGAHPGVISWIELRISSIKRGDEYRLLPESFYERTMLRNTGINQVSQQSPNLEVKQTPFCTIVIPPKSNNTAQIFFSAANIDEHFTFHEGEYEIKAYYYKDNLESKPIPTQSVKFMILKEHCNFLDIGGYVILRAGPWKAVKGSYAFQPVTNDQKASSLARWSLALSQMGFYDDAKQKLEKALNIATDKGYYEQSLGELLLEMYSIDNNTQHLNNAFKHLSSASNRNSYEYQSNLLLAKVLMHLHRNDEAIEQLKIAIARGCIPFEGFERYYIDLQQEPEFKEMVSYVYKSDIEKYFDKIGYSQMLQDFVIGFEEYKKANGLQ